MADDKDKIIIIEEEPKQEKQAQAESQSQTVEDSGQLSSEIQPPKKGKKMLFLGVSIFIVVALAVILTYALLSKKPVSNKHNISQPKPTSKTIKTNSTLDLHFLEALNLENKGNLDQAIEEFKKSKNYLFLAYLNIAKIYQMQNNQQMANDYIDKANEYLKSTLNDPNSYIDSYLYLFSYYMQNKDFNKAQALLDTLRHAHLQSHELDIMNIYYNFIVQQNTQDIEKQIKQLINAGYQDKLLYEMLGYIYATKQDYAQASNYFLKANDNAIAQHNLALLEYATNNLENALNFAIDSLNKKQNNQLAYLAYLIALKTNHINTAYTLISNLNSNDAMDKFSIVPIINQKMLSQQINFKKYGIDKTLISLFITQFIEPLSYNPKLSSNIETGNVYLSFGLLNNAKELYLNAIGTSLSLNEANRAYKYYMSNDLVKSLELYKESYKNNPQDPILYYNVALLYQKNYYFDRAKQMFSIMINRYPNFPLPYLNMALIYNIEGDFPKAEFYLNQFLSKSAPNKSKILLKYIEYADLLSKKLSAPKYINVKEFVLLQAVQNNDFNYLELEKNYVNDILHLKMDSKNMIGIVKTLSEFNINLNRLLVDLYLKDNQPAKALEVYTKLNDYNANDYYTMGICYLLLGYKNQADNYLTKSLLISKNNDTQNALFAKLMIQILNKNLAGMQELTKKISSNKGLLTFDVVGNK